MDHGGRRARLRRRFERVGLAGLDDHEVLEMLLGFAIPRKDTHALARALLRRFGSLAGVLGAERLELLATDGVGPLTGTLLSLMAPLARRYQQQCAQPRGPLLDGAETAARFLSGLLAGESDEMFYVLCLDACLRLRALECVARGSPEQVRVEPRGVVAAVMRHRVSSVILAHNHPGGRARPSGADRQLTGALTTLLAAIRVQVRDHIVVAPGDWFSFAQAGWL
ncbi:MAG: DNA repair protein RadC [Deltaproteobacteria bacterium]|nr:DNA repair protein RadC [Deltaproteobacteria bacterium]